MKFMSTSNIPKLNSINLSENKITELLGINPTFLLLTNINIMQNKIIKFDKFFEKVIPSLKYL